MATVEFLEKRVAGKEKEIATLQKKLDRIYKAQASNWENNPYWYNESDIGRTLKEIEIAQNALTDYQAQLAAQVEKDNSRDVQVILDFLQEWKDRVFDLYGEGLQKMFGEIEHIRKLYFDLHNMDRRYGSDEYKQLKAEIDDLNEELKSKQKGVFEDIPKDSPSYRRFYNEKRKVATGEYEWLKDYFGYHSLSDALAALKTLLDREADAKYDDIIERTNKIVGQITDASQLEIGMKGDLNGYITGTRGKASVQTIGAGGYNIQVYHFRTLIKPMK